MAPAPSYFSFAICGIVMSLVIFAASTGVAHRVREDQLAGTLEILCAQPLRTFEFALGIISFPLDVRRRPGDRVPGTCGARLRSRRT